VKKDQEAAIKMACQKEILALHFKLKSLLGMGLGVFSSIETAIFKAHFFIWE